jgi:sugar O-acyltransferase (sialic acid O-acetyltransferase NeuD family)
MTDYVLLGGGAFAREIHDWFSPGMQGTDDKFLGYLDDGDGQPMLSARGLKHLGRTGEYRPAPNRALVMAVGAPTDKAALANRIGPSATFASLIHPLAWVSSSARLGQGAVIGPFCDISADAIADDFVTLNAYSSLGHDVQIGRFSTLSGYVDLTGAVSVGAGCFFGSGSRVMPGVKIGNNCRIGAGAVVVRNVGENVTLYAAPARRL